MYNKTHYQFFDGRSLGFPFWAFAIGIFLFVVFINWTPTSTNAQTQPNMFLSWHTETYTPPGYGGRPLPTANSLVSLTLDVIEGGKRVDLSPYAIRWYIGETPIKNGEGLDRITARIPNVVGEGTYKLRAQINNYKGQTLIKVVNIPVVSPKAVLVDSTGSPQVAPSQTGLLADTSLELEGVPYFFNAKRLSELVFEWTTNGKQFSDYENPDQNFLSVNTNKDAAPGETILVNLFIRNPLFELEYASYATTLTFAQ